MLTPVEVRKVRLTQRRSARVIFDHGGMFVAVDGDGEPQRDIVGRVLQIALAYASPPAEQVGPAVTLLSPVPLCHGNVMGLMHEGARQAVEALLRAAGYEVR